jgi:hypothetical protein
MEPHQRLGNYIRLTGVDGTWSVLEVRKWLMGDITSPGRH